MYKKLPAWRKWMYGSGDFGFSLTSTIVVAYFAIFLTDVVGVSAKIAAIAILIGRTWDYVNDPLFGYISDRTRTRLGRRRPFLLIGPVPYAIAFTLMWWKPPIHTDIALVVYYALAFVFYDAAATMIYMPYFALTPEMTSDYDERTSITSVRAFFSIFGSLVGFSVPLLIVKGWSPTHLTNALQMGLIFGIIAAIPMFLVFIGTFERPEFMQQEQPGIKASIKALVGNRPFIFSAIIYLFTWVTMDLIEAYLIYYIKYVVNRENKTTIIMLTIFVVAILALPLWTWVSAKLNKRKAYIIGMVFFAGVLLFLINMSPATSFSLIMILCVLAGIGVSAVHVIPWSMIPDAIEYGELKTGERHEGVFYSFISLSQKIASSITVPLALLFLNATGYIPNSAHQPASAINGIRIVVGPIPWIMMTMGIIFAIFYPLGRESYTQIAQELEERRVATPEEEP